MLGPLACLIVGVSLILILILVLRAHAFLALLTAALAVAFLSDRVAPENAISTVTAGFGDLMAAIGILLILAAIVGKCLMDSGGADRIVRGFTRLFGRGREHYSLLASGFVLSIPVFFDTVFYLLAPLARAVYVRRRKDYALLICAAGAGAAVTHALVPPTPGPIVVSQQLGVSIGTAILTGLLASLVPTVVGGIWYARWLNRRLSIDPAPMYGATEEELEREASRPTEELPRLWASLLPVVVPVGLLSGSTVAPFWVAEGSLLRMILLIGDKNVAFLLGTVLAITLLVRQKKLTFSETFKLLEPAIASGAVIAFITCAGGAFGRVLQAAGIGELIAEMASEWGFSLLLVSFATALLIRVAQGSATVAMITTAGIVGPTLATLELGYHPAYLVAVIGFGATAASWMNDSGFWVVGQLSGMTEGETLKVWTAMLTIMAFSGLGWVWLLTLVLPLG